MIRTVRVPRFSSRLRDTPVTSATVNYIGSSCTLTDPSTGLCLADFSVADPSNPPIGAGVGSGLPGDPGIDAAVAAFADNTNSAANLAALNAGISPSSILAQALGSNTPMAIPGPGLGLIKIPSNVLMWLGLGLIAFLILGQQQAGFRRSRS